MDFKTILAQKSFWKSVFWLGLSFLVLYNIISILFETGGFHFQEFYGARTEDGKIYRFIIGQILAAFLYGFILSFGQFRVRGEKK